MIKRNYINEYVTAIYDLAVENDAQNQFRIQLIEIVKAFNDNPDFIKILSSDSFNKSDKKQLINNVFNHDIHPMLINLFLYLIDKNYEKYLIEISERVIAYIDEKTNKLYVKVFTPFKINDSTIEIIKDKISKITNKDAIATVIIDPDLIGGIRVEYDSKVLDYSIEAKIRNIKLTTNQGD